VITTQSETAARSEGKPWPRVKWNRRDLQWVAEALQVMNPNGFRDADSLVSYIVSLSETELYRNDGPMDISTGGWTICFFRAWDNCPGYDFCAVVTVSAYTAHGFATRHAAD